MLNGDLKLQQIDMFWRVENGNEGTQLVSDTFFLRTHGQTQKIKVEDKLRINIPEQLITIYTDIEHAWEYARFFIRHKGYGWRYTISWAANTDMLFITGRILKQFDTKIYGNLDEKVIQNILEHGGLTLIAGDYKQGKTTLAYTLLRKFIGTELRAVSTLEDPIEQVLPPPARQRDIAEMHWVKYIPLVMREGAEIVFFGEITTGRTAYLMMQYAVSGLPTLATIHASAPDQILPRFAELIRSEREGEFPFSFITQTLWVKLEHINGELVQIIDWMDWYSVRKMGLPPTEHAYGRLPMVNIRNSIDNSPPVYGQVYISYEQYKNMVLNMLQS